MPKVSWYVVFTRPNWEKKVVDSFSRKGIECYCPCKVVMSNSGGKKKMVSQPLFASFVFVRINSSRIDYVRKVEGVINMMYWLNQPAVIRDIEIEMMKRFLKEHDNVHVERAVVNVQDIVKIKNVSLIDNESTLGIKLDKVKLTLPTLGFALVGEVQTDDLEMDVEKIGVTFREEPGHMGTSVLQNTLNYGTL